jgi:hypothetical protein
MATVSVSLDADDSYLSQDHLLSLLDLAPQSLRQQPQKNYLQLKLK